MCSGRWWREVFTLQTSNRSKQKYLQKKRKNIELKKIFLLANLCKITPLKIISNLQHDFCDTPQQQPLPGHGSRVSGRGSGPFCTPRATTPRVHALWLHCQFISGNNGFKSSHGQLWPSAYDGCQGRCADLRPLSETGQWVYPPCIQLQLSSYPNNGYSHPTSPSKGLEPTTATTTVPSKVQFIKKSFKLFGKFGFFKTRFWSHGLNSLH